MLNDISALADLDLCYLPFQPKSGKRFAFMRERVAIIGAGHVAVFGKTIRAKTRNCRSEAESGKCLASNRDRRLSPFSPPTPPFTTRSTFSGYDQQTDAPNLQSAGGLCLGGNGCRGASARLAPNSMTAGQIDSPFFSAAISL